MGANMSEGAITRTARSVTTLQELSTRFDKVTGVPVTRGAHSTMDDTKDVNSLVSVIMKKKILETRKGISHSTFKKFSSNPLPSLNQEKVLNWISNEQRQMIKYKHAIGEGDESDTEASDIESESTSDGESEELNIEIITD